MDLQGAMAHFLLEAWYNIKSPANLAGLSDDF